MLKSNAKNIIACFYGVTSLPSFTPEVAPTDLRPRILLRDQRSTPAALVAGLELACVAMPKYPSQFSNQKLTNIEGSEEYYR